MKTKYLNTLVGLVVLAALWASFNYYDKRKGREGPKTASTAEEKIFSVESSHIQALTLRPRSGEPITCRREGANWVIDSPRKVAADQTIVSGVLTNLTGATVDQVVDPHPAALNAFGLDPPAYTLEVSTDAKPAKFTLQLGDDTPTSGGIYAQVAGNPRVVTLPSYLKSSLEKNLFDLRDKRAVTVDADQIQRIEAESNGKHWTLVKNPEGVWDLVLPPPVRADRFQVDGLLNQLRNLSMLTVVAEDKKSAGKFGFGVPTLSVTFRSPAGSQKVVIGKKDGERYDAMNSALEPIFTLDSSFLNQYQKDPADLRDKELFTFSNFETKHLEVDTPKTHWTFDQDKNKWKETAPKAKDVPSDKMDAILSKIHDLRAISFPKDHPGNLAAFGLTKPAYKFQVRFSDKNLTEIVEASKVGEHVYARPSTDPLPCELSKAALDDIEKSLSEL